MKKHIGYKILLAVILASLLYSCSPTRYVADKEYLLNRINVKIEGENVNKAEIKKNIRQKPNTRILGVARFHLGLYNLSGRDGEKKFNKWLRSIGEAPVIYSDFLTQRSAFQVKQYLNNKGYFNAVVTDSVHFFRKKAVVDFKIIPGPVTRVEDIIFKDRYNYAGSELSDTSALMQLVLEDTCNTLLRRNMPLDMDIMEKERERITKMLRKRGYFNFSKNFIQFYADTNYSKTPDVARLLLNIGDNMADSDAYRKYRIESVNVNFDYNPLGASADNESVYVDTTYNGYGVRFDSKLKIKPKVIIETIQFRKGELYDVQKVIDSYARLQTLNLFKFINILFREKENEDGQKVLVCDIQLTPMKRQSYNVFLEGTHNSGNIGVGGNFSYNHRNLFKGAENLTFSIWGALKKEQITAEKKVFSTTEIGAELKLVTPQFWMPIFRLKDFRRNFAPRSSVSLSYSYENTPYYNRKVAGAKFGYLWQKKDKRWRYNFDLIDLNYVLMANVDQGFLDNLKNEYVKSAYIDHMILSASFTGVFTDQVVNTKGNFNYFRGNLESSGNFLWAMDKLFNAGKTIEVEEQYYKVLGVRYAQFIKADGEYRFNHYINRANTLVYRFLLGCGYPYGNMKALPFEEAFYCGGANGIRAWQSRTLGPGSYVPANKYPNSVGDFKIEANVEYRFKLFWLLEGALFVDAGNIWNINRFEDRPGTRLGKDFYKQIAVGTGAGLRLDANFFLLRFDLGIKMRDPAQPEKERFVLLNSNGGFKRSVFNIAIGYPF